jgi:NADPH:quinone reductase-like Zn-dependent oxidoreductase
MPAPAPNEILVNVRASALNRADLAQREGNYPAPPGAPPDILGMEFAGEVAGVGTEVVAWQPGDRVFGIVGGGGNAEYLVTDAQSVARIPDRLSWTDAAAIPEVFITSHDALFTQAGLKRDERVLIHAVGSGVGLAATQLVRAYGAHTLRNRADRGQDRSCARLRARARHRRRRRREHHRHRIRRSHTGQGIRGHARSRRRTVRRGEHSRGRAARIM